MSASAARQAARRGICSVLWLCSLLIFTSAAAGETSGRSSTLSVSAPHLYLTCPAGVTARLPCVQSGAARYPKDYLRHTWRFTPHADLHCSGREGPRHSVVGGHSNGSHSLPAGLSFEAEQDKFWVVLHNVTEADQGRYCCMVLDVQVEHHHGTVVQEAHSHIILLVSPRRKGSQECTVWDGAPASSLLPAIVAGAACIIALMSLPLILVLVYKQRNTRAGRRAQELVRMDSEAQGHENPVFFGESPQVKTRTVSQIMTRQSSETGRHLLSEPGTPLSPPAHGDVFFPIEDTILESPDLVEV